MEIIDTMLIERIRKALIKRYDRDQQIQQMIEEIGAEEGLNETELSIVYQAYLEVKERVYYTSSLVDLWNQIEDVQKRLSEQFNGYAKNKALPIICPDKAVVKRSSGRRRCTQIYTLFLPANCPVIHLN